MKTFTIVSSRDQKKYVLETEATTMVELTAAMDAAGINYTDMTLYEGLTKAEYDPSKGDAILPHDVPYKGETTNNLVFMLTAPQKKIKSGMGYAEMKAYIKDNGLTEAFAAEYGKNYTQGKTSEFSAFISAHLNNSTSVEKPTVVKHTAVSESTDVAEPRKEYVDTQLREAFTELLKTLEDYECLSVDDKDAILDTLNKVKFTSAAATETVGKKSPYSDDAIDNMFADL